MEKDQNTNFVEQKDKSEELKTDKLDNEAQPDASENNKPEKEITPPQGWRLSPYSDKILTQKIAKNR